MKRIITVLAAAALAGLSSCAKPEPMQITAVEPAVQAPASAIPAAANAQAPWYAARLEALGFYVFPKPEPMPPFAVTTLDGRKTGLDEALGKVTLLNFWATWCPPCRMEMPSIDILYKELKGEAFTVMAISVNEPKATVTGFLKSNPYSFPIYLDESGAASASFVTRGIPTTFILDKQGRAIAGIVGSRSYDGPEVMSIMRELAARLP